MSLMLFPWKASAVLSWDLRVYETFSLGRMTHREASTRFSGSHSTGLIIVLQINSQAPYTEKLTACDRSSCEEMLSPGNGAEQAH